MSKYYDDGGESRDEENYRWEREHDHRIIWKCPICGYSYESERNVNEALNCPDCKCQTVNSGESYAA